MCFDVYLGRFGSKTLHLGSVVTVDASAGVVGARLPHRIAPHASRPTPAQFSGKKKKREKQITFSVYYLFGDSFLVTTEYRLNVGGPCPFVS